MNIRADNRKRLLTIVALLLILSTILLNLRHVGDMKARYANAVTDAVFVETGEIEPLMTLMRDSPLTTWDDEGRVLLLSWHRHRKRHIQSEEMNLAGSVWTFTDKEIAAWYR